MSDIAEWAEDNIHLMYIGANVEKQHFQLHHVVGRSAKHNKIEIGHWFILPVPFDLHDVSSNHPLNVTHHKKKFTGHFGFQRELFNEMVEDMRGGRLYATS